MKNVYEIVDLPFGADIEGMKPEEKKRIKHSLKQRMLSAHPDKNLGAPQNTSEFHNYNQAYQVLFNTKYKKCYDETYSTTEKMEEDPAKCHIAAMMEVDKLMVTHEDQEKEEGEEEEDDDAPTFTEEEIKKIFQIVSNYFSEEREKKGFKNQLSLKDEIEISVLITIFLQFLAEDFNVINDGNPDIELIKSLIKNEKYKIFLDDSDKKMKKAILKKLHQYLSLPQQVSFLLSAYSIKEGEEFARLFLREQWLNFFGSKNGTNFELVISDLLKETDAALFNLKAKETRLSLNSQQASALPKKDEFLAEITLISKIKRYLLYPVSDEKRKEKIEKFLKDDKITEASKKIILEKFEDFTNREAFSIKENIEAAKCLLLINSTPKIEAKPDSILEQIQRKADIQSQNLQTPDFLEKRKELLISLAKSTMPYWIFTKIGWKKQREKEARLRAYLELFISASKSTDAAELNSENIKDFLNNLKDYYISKEKPNDIEDIKKFILHVLQLISKQDSETTIKQIKEYTSKEDINIELHILIKDLEDNNPAKEILNLALHLINSGDQQTFSQSSHSKHQRENPKLPQQRSQAQRLTQQTLTQELKPSQNKHPHESKEQNGLTPNQVRIICEIVFTAVRNSKIIDSSQTEFKKSGIEIIDTNSDEAAQWQKIDNNLLEIMKIRKNLCNSDSETAVSFDKEIVGALKEKGFNVNESQLDGWLATLSGHARKIKEQYIAQKQYSQNPYRLSGNKPSSSSSSLSQQLTNSNFRAK